MSKRALVIGINNYPGTQNDLSGCVNDAKDWAAALQKRGFEAPKVLLDQAATKAAIVNEMRALIEGATKGDVLVITFSGHGTWQPDDDGDEEDYRDEALCPHDISKHVLLDDELYDIFSSCARGVRLIFISDSCHSGTVARFAPAQSNRKVRFMPIEAFEHDDTKLARARRVERAPARTGSRGTALLLAGCKDTEYSYDAEFSGRANGAFTRVALTALQNLAPNATYKDWFAAIRAQLPSMDYPQTPQLTGTRTQKSWPVLV